MAIPSSIESAIFKTNEINAPRVQGVMCPDQFWFARTNFGVVFGPAGPLLVAKIGPIFSPDQIFRDEAIPLKSIDAEHVAEKMIQVFAMVGVPRES